MRQRVEGFDVARAIAVFGMVIVNFKIAMNADTGSASLIKQLSLFEGRASALFVILAGIGLTFLTNRARTIGDESVLAKARLSLIKRGLLLIIIGLLYTPIWEADILHFYGFYFLLAASLFNKSDKTLLRTASIIAFSFPLLMLVFDYEQNWDWATLTYLNFWSLDGMARHILFNGFHPVFPWVSFLLFGMWLGRQDLSDRSFRKRLFLYAILILTLVESICYGLRVFAGDGNVFFMTPEEVEFLFSISMIPPLPQYVVSASCSSVVVLLGCLYLSERFSTSKVNTWLYQTGQLSLTLYVAHVIVGMGLLEHFGLLENQTIEFSLMSAISFCLGAVFFSVVWLRIFTAGPLEWLFRRVAR